MILYEEFCIKDISDFGNVYFYKDNFHTKRDLNIYSLNRFIDFLNKCFKTNMHFILLIHSVRSDSPQ